MLEPLDMRPDISILSATDRKDPHPDDLHWRAVDLWIENKNKNGDDVFRRLDKARRPARSSKASANPSQNSTSPVTRRPLTKPAVS